ncbi:MAG: helix-turn-helix domain-containing protein, partial [bacterium]
ALLTRLIDQNGRPKPGLENESPLSTKDVAVLFRMSERGIRVQAAKGKLPHTRTLGGGKLLFPADRIAELYASHQSTSQSSMQRENKRAR